MEVRRRNWTDSIKRDMRNNQINQRRIREYTVFFHCVYVCMYALTCMSLPLIYGHDWPLVALWNNGHGLVGHFYTDNISIQNNVQEKNDNSHGQREWQGDQYYIIIIIIILFLLYYHYYYYSVSCANRFRLNGLLFMTLPLSHLLAAPQLSVHNLQPAYLMSRE